jgi:hypothetical protein
MSGSKPSVLVMGYVVRGPLGGMAWSDLQYLVSLLASGHELYYVEDSEDYPSCYNPITNETTADPKYGLAFASEALAKVGMEGHWSFHDAHTGTWHGPLGGLGSKVFERADVLLNLAGVNPLRDWAMDVPMRILVDQDPAFTQIRNLTDPARALFTKAHNAFATFAENVGTDGCSVPDDGVPWRPTRQPVMVDGFPVSDPPREGRFTTVMQWESYPGVEHDGRRYGMKSVSFEDYLSLPSHTDVDFEIALGAPGPVRSRLEEAGWTTIDPRGVTRTPDTYETFIRGSKGEFGIAKHGYVVTNSGWFSERSLAYMANARPVVIQDTGFSRHIPVGEGVMPFTSPAEAVDALETVAGDERRHGLAARAVVAEHFEGRAVVAELLDNAAHPPF